VLVLGGKGSLQAKVKYIHPGFARKQSLGGFKIHKEKIKDG